jgi:hypothetical protein
MFLPSCQLREFAAETVDARLVEHVDTILAHGTMCLLNNAVHAVAKNAQQWFRARSGEICQLDCNLERMTVQVLGPAR